LAAVKTGFVEMPQGFHDVFGVMAKYLDCTWIFPREESDGGEMLFLSIL